MVRTLDHLQIAAALRASSPADTLAAALAVDLGAADGLPAAARAWLGIRDRWFDRIVRLRTMPGHAQLAIVGIGLDPGPGRLPPGLLGTGTLWLVDRPEILALRAERLRDAGLSDPPQARHLAADPLDPEAVLAALHAADLQPELPLTTLWIGGAPLGDLTPLHTLAAGLFNLPIPKVQLVFDWFGPDQKHLPDDFALAISPWGHHLPSTPLGMEVGLKGLGATHTKTTALLSHGTLQIAFGTEAERIS